MCIRTCKQKLDMLEGSKLCAIIELNLTQTGTISGAFRPGRQTEAAVIRQQLSKGGVSQ